MAATASEPQQQRQVLRGPTLLTAPMFLVGVIGGAVAIVSALVMASDPARIPTAAILGLVVGLLLALCGFGGAAGCRIVVANNQICDQLAWLTRQRVQQDQVAAAHVTAGAWRWFVLELHDGSAITLIGAGPQQFPARLIANGDPADIAAIEVLMGPDPAPRSDT